VRGEIRYDEWLAELQRVTADCGPHGDPAALTVREMSQRWGISVHRLRVLLQQAQAAGLLQVFRKRTMRVDGQAAKVPAYRITTAQLACNAEPTTSSRAPAQKNANARQHRTVKAMRAL